MSFQYLFFDEKQCIEQLCSYNQIFCDYWETLKAHGKHTIMGLVPAFTENMSRLPGIK